MVNLDPGTEKKILNAAKKVFLLKGKDGARMQDIADEAEINKALLHYYFRTKAQLFQMIFEEIAQGFFPKIATIMVADVDLFEKIKELCEEYITLYIKNPFVPLFIVNEINKEPEIVVKKVLGEIKSPIKNFIAQVEDEIRNGKIKDINPVQLLLNIISLCMFPFIGRRLMEHVVEMDQEQFSRLLKQRKVLVSQFIIDSIKK